MGKVYTVYNIHSVSLDAHQVVGAYLVALRRRLRGRHHRLRRRRR